jgi:putative phosphoesterase
MADKTVKIGVLADTHVFRTNAMRIDLLNELTKVDLIIHLGDFESRELVDDLSYLTDFVGVAGNHDGAEIRDKLPDTDIIEINGKRLGLTHGNGCWSPVGLRPGLQQRFRGERLDAVLYGHTHVSRNKIVDDVLFFNPGSVAGRFPATKPSYGVLTIGETIVVEVHELRETQVLDESGFRWHHLWRLLTPYPLHQWYTSL